MLDRGDDRRWIVRRARFLRFDVGPDNRVDRLLAFEALCIERSLGA